MLLTFENFGGVSPRVTPRQLAAHMGVNARNVELESGSLRPMKQMGASIQAITSGATRLHHFLRSQWIALTGVASIVKGPFPNDTQERTYYTQDGTARVTAAGLVSGGVINTSYLLGVPAPAGAPTIGTIDNTGASATTDDDEDRYYAYTYVTAWGEEGPLSPPSALLSVDPVSDVTINGLAGVTGAYQMAYKRLYRTNTDASGEAQWQLVKTIPYANTSTVDDVPGAQLGEVCPSQTWDPPGPLNGLVSMPNEFLAGYFGRTLCFSEQRVPHAWPLDYRITIEPAIVALCATGNSLVVGTEASPYLVSGSSPSAMSADKLESEQACIAPRSMVSVGGLVMYASPDGLVAVRGHNVEVVTAGHLTRAQWQALSPTGLVGAAYEGKYLGFFAGGGGFVFDPGGGERGLVWLDGTITAAFSEPYDDALYVVSGNQLRQWNASASALTATWRSAPVEVPRPTSFAFAQVRALAYPVQLRVIYDGVTISTQSIASADAVRLPSGSRGRTVSIEVVTTNEVEAVLLATAGVELAEAP